LPTDAARPASIVVERILGGGPTSRLFNTLREKHGWTYGVQSKINWPIGPGYMTTSTDVRAEVTDSAAAVLLAELRRIRSEPVSTAELAAAKDALTGVFPLKVQTAEQVAAQVRTIKLQGLPDSWLPRYRTSIANVTAVDVQAAANKYIRPDDGVLVVVGDAPKIIAGLRALGTVKTVDITGKPVQLSDGVPKASNVRVDASKLAARRDSSTVMISGNPIGYRLVTVKREAASFILTDETSIAGGMIQQKTEAVLTEAGDVRKVTLQGKIRGQDAAVDLQYSPTHAQGTAVTPTPEGPQTTKIDTDIPNGTWDDNTAIALLVALPWAPGAKFTLPVLSSGKGTVSMWTYEVKATEKVTVPAGTFDVFRVELSGSQQPSTLYITTTAPHRIVKNVGGGGQLVQVLEK
jgi:hypothetical protein